MTVVCALLIVAFVAREYCAAKERQELLRRIQAPQNVIAEEATAHKRPKPMQVWSDEQYKQLAESRGQVPVGD